MKKKRVEEVEAQGMVDELLIRKEEVWRMTDELMIREEEVEDDL